MSLNVFLSSPSLSHDNMCDSTKKRGGANLHRHSSFRDSSSVYPHALQRSFAQFKKREMPPYVMARRVMREIEWATRLLPENAMMCAGVSARWSATPRRHPRWSATSCRRQQKLWRLDKSHCAHFFFSPFLLSLPSPQVVSAIPPPFTMVRLVNVGRGLID